MAMTHNVAFKNKLLDAMFNGAAGIDFNSGTLRIRSGAPPGAGNAATGTVLATVTLPADAFAAAASGAIAKSGTWEDLSADATGAAGHFRLEDSTGTYLLEGTVTITGGGGDMTVDNTAFAAGQPFTITGFSFSL